MTADLIVGEAQRHEWYPVCASHDLPMRHVFHGQLWGQEMAIWRADDGHVNVWQNRCLHRGVRLSIGANDGAELKCAYHGWRYASRTAGCTYIPAHPADAPARTICNHVYRSVERYGLVWTALDPAGDPPSFDDLPDDAIALRGVSVNAPPDRVQAALSGVEGNGADVEHRYFVQPVDSNRAVIRGLLLRRPTDPTAAWRSANGRLTALRDSLESDAESQPPVAPIVPIYQPNPQNLPATAGSGGRVAGHRVRVARKRAAGADIAAFRLEPLDGVLPAFQPGAHIDVHLPDGQVRQYSLTNGPEDVVAYEIAVKREADGRGGSQALHANIREGDVLAISAPHNNFPLRRDAEHTLFIAGGIGATPLIAMAKTLNRSGLPFAFHAFARTPDHVPLPAVLGALDAEFHLGLDPSATADCLSRLLATPDPDAHVYICGPAPMMDLARTTAARAGWSDHQIHFEYFANDADIDMSSRFEVALARSAMTVDVASGQSILDALRAAGVDLPSSCEQGACGTCRCTVIDGVPDHQDVYLSDREKAEGRQIMTCVSRAKTPRLVLDL